MSKTVAMDVTLIKNSNNVFLQQILDSGILLFPITQYNFSLVGHNSTHVPIFLLYQPVHECIVRRILARRLNVSHELNRDLVHRLH